VGHRAQIVTMPADGGAQTAFTQCESLQNRASRGTSKAAHDGWLKTLPEFAHDRPRPV
jgi:hypothetical protein